MNRIVIFSDNNGWHEEQLLRAFAARQITPTLISLRDCRIGFGTGRLGVDIPGFRDELPCAAMVRAVPGGSFEEVSLRLDILHALTESGALIYNDARMIERTVDKGMTSFLLARHGIATPATWVCESQAEAREVIRIEALKGNRVVLKPLFGNCGRGLLLLQEPDQLPPPEEVNGVYYMQSFIPQRDGSGRDWRVLVINHRAVAAMERVSDHWITNRARGGRCLQAVLTERLRRLAEEASAAAGTSYAGVDIIADAENNYLVLEVNGVPAWRGLQSVCQDEIARLLVADFLARLDDHRLQSAAV